MHWVTTPVTVQEMEVVQKNFGFQLKCNTYFVNVWDMFIKYSSFEKPTESQILNILMSFLSTHFVSKKANACSKLTGCLFQLCSTSFCLGKYRNKGKYVLPRDNLIIV